MTTRQRPLFTREDYVTESRVLWAAAALMDGRSFHAKQYRKLAAMLVFADVHMPKGLPTVGLFPVKRLRHQRG